MFNDAIKMTGTLKLVLTDENGNIKQEEEVKNLVVTVGKNYIASRMKDATATAMTHMEVGTGTTAAARHGGSTHGGRRRTGSDRRTSVRTL